ncbi:Mpo1-like protein [Alteromonas gracilis]|uniref:Mpo1-like protein n=1 Tax=Alteromonas gracilis TaxID=1479524 RepID=UPI003736C31E
MTTQTSANTQFASFKEFYPFYLNEHKDSTCRTLHFIGSWLVLGVIALAIFTATWSYLWFIPVVGYGFAWVGHFFFEKNRPATFKHPIYSLIGDWVMFKDILTGKISLKGE